MGLSGVGESMVGAFDLVRGPDDLDLSATPCE
jgi:hypothetical protein